MKCLFLLILLSIVVGQPSLGFGAAPMEEGQNEHLLRLLDGPLQVKSGGDINVDFTLNNETGDIIAGVGGKRCATDNKFEVLDADGTRLSPKQDPKVADNAPLGPVPNDQISSTMDAFELKPGQSLNETCNLTNLFDMTHPGAYTVLVDDKLRDGFEAKSNKIIITVFP